MQAPARPNDGPQASNLSNKSTLPPQPQTPNGGLSRSASGAGNGMQVRNAQENTAPAQGKREPPPPKFFTVRVGHVPGIYDTWVEANQQTADFSGAECEHTRLDVLKFSFPMLTKHGRLNILSRGLADII